LGDIIGGVREKNMVMDSEELGTKDDCAGEGACKFTSPGHTSSETKEERG
jgi:hypothetical protein